MPDGPDMSGARPSLRSRLRRQARPRPARRPDAGAVGDDVRDGSETSPAHVPGEAGRSKAFAAEERSALVRALVIGVNLATYWIWLQPSGLGRPALAAAISLVAVAYAAYDLLGHPHRRFPVMATSAWTTLTDGVLITLWLHATGGFASPYYLLWYLSLVAVTFRFDWRAPLAAGALYAAAYVSVVAWEGALAAHGVEMAIRVSYILLCGVLGAFLAQATMQVFSARSRLQARIREAESFRSLAEASSEALVVSSGGILLECNRAYCEMMGLPRAALVGSALTSLIEPGSRSEAERHFADPTGPLEVWRQGPHGRQLLRVEARPITYQGRPARFASLRDITHERDAQRQAEQNALHLSLALEAGQVGTWDLDLANGTTRRNARFDQIYGHEAPKPRWTVDDFVAAAVPEQRDDVRAAFEEARRTGRLEMDCRIHWPDGSQHWVALQGQVRFDPQGLPAGLVGIARDSSAAHQAEQARVEALETAARLKEWKAVSLLAAVVESSIDGILTKDLSGIITSWNPACESMFGYTAEEAIGQPIHMLYPKGEEMAEARVLARISAGKPVRIREAERVRKDGSRFWVSVSASPLRDADGTVVGCASIKRDITQVRAVEQRRVEAKEAALLLAAVVESSIDGILTKDLSGIITSWNPACESMFGYTAEEAIGRPVTMLYPNGEETAEAQILARIRAGRPVRIREARHVHKDGSTLWVSFSASPLRDASGTIIGAAAIKRDITQARVAEKERLEAKARVQEFDRLKEVNRFKTQFINTAAHELRTPLLPLRTQLDLMLTDPDHPPLPSQRQAMAVMQRNLDRLGALVEDLLTVARSQAGRLQLQVEPVDLADIVQEAQQTFETVATTRGVRLVVEPSGPVPVLADGKRIGQVLANLLSNAFKFTPPGGEVRVSLRPDKDGAMVTVSDTGVGISPADRDRLFQPFVQVHDAAQVTQPGSGLGLYICRQLVEMHGGSIGCQSAGRGKGSAFWFTLPGIPFRPPPDAATEWNPQP